AHRTPGEAGQFRLTGDLRSDGDGFEPFVSSPHVWSAGRILNGGAPRACGGLAHRTAMECSIALPHRLFTAADRVRREHCKREQQHQQRECAATQPDSWTVHRKSRRRKMIAASVKRPTTQQSAWPAAMSRCVL